MNEIEEHQQEPAAANRRPRVVIVGGGFGGLAAAHALGKAPVRVLLIDLPSLHDEFARAAHERLEGAVVGRNFAVLQIGGFRMAGFFAWLVWAGVHLMFLSARENRVRVIAEWFWSHLTRQRGSRLILGPGGKSPLFD